MEEKVNTTQEFANDSAVAVAPAPIANIEAENTITSESFQDSRVENDLATPESSVTPISSNGTTNGASNHTDGATLQDTLTAAPEATPAETAVEVQPEAATTVQAQVQPEAATTVQAQPEATLEAQPEATIEAQPEAATEVQALAQSEPATTTEAEPEAATPAKPTSLMEQLLNEASSSPKALHYGDVLDGIVMRKDRDEILVDIGAKSEGTVPNKELSTLNLEELNDIKVGEQILVFVIQPENQDGHAILSIDKAKMEKSWRRLQKQYEAEEIIEAEVTGYNKGGLLVNLEGVRGFVPSSQVSGLAAGTEAAKQSEMTRLVNSKLPLKIIEINRNRNRLILSERLAAQAQRDVQKDRLMNELEKGQVRDGIVTSICDFGAFVDIGGADGLVHLSELSWSRVNHPNEVLKVNDKVKVYVLEVNPDDKKVALSIKRTQPEPWSQVMANYQPGQLVEGTITQLANFGAFARIANGIEGLIHVSELAEGRVQHPRSVVKEGDVVTLRIIRIDPQRKRMGLSLKRAVEGYEGSLADLPEDDDYTSGGGSGGGSRSRRRRDENGEGGEGGGVAVAVAEEQPVG